VIEVAVGRFHACALRQGGEVVCWGGNAFGQLGDGTTVNRPAPAAVPGIGSVARIAAGSRHTCVVTVAGAVLCWGSNADGQLGDGTTASRARPGAVHFDARR
jgi:alpha-tubulin suppressor-like RCC1 family protein